MRTRPGVVASLVILVAATARAQPADVADTGRIAGHVITLDAGRVPDVTVTLGRVDDQGMTFQTLVARTDQSGAFGFAQLPPGRYRVWASRPGYTSRQFPDMTASLVRTFDLGALIDLPTNGQAADLQVVIHRAASIAGRIMRPDGSAAPNIQVLAAFRLGTSTQPLLETRTTSHSDGRYEITGLPPGEYLVGALNAAVPTQQRLDITSADQTTRNLAAVATAVAHTTWYPSVADPEPGSTVTVVEGVNAEGVDILLTPAQRFHVSGQVLWPAGVTIDRISIDYGNPAGSNSGVWYPDDPGGLFTLAGIEPGALTMLVRADSDQGMLMGIATTDVTDASVEDVRVIIDRPGLVAGRIVYEGNVPAASRATGLVAQQKLLKVPALYPVPQSSIDSSGRFELRNTVGEYDFALEGLGAGFSIQRVMRNEQRLPANRIAVGPGETIRDIEIVVGR